LLQYNKRGLRRTAARSAAGSTPLDALERVHDSDERHWVHRFSDAQGDARRHYDLDARARPALTATNVGAAVNAVDDSNFFIHLRRRLESSPSAARRLLSRAPTISA